MKIAISNIAWSRSEDDEISKILFEFSIKAIEVAPTKLWDNPVSQTDESVQAYLNYWDKKDIDIIAMQSLLFGCPELTIFGGDDRKEATLRYLSKIINLGSKLGISVFVFGSPKNRQTMGLKKSKVMDIAINFFRLLGELAYGNNAKFCIEPNSAVYGCDFICTTDEGIELVKEIAHPGFRLHLDAGVMALNNEEYEKSIERAFEYMEHFHVSEPYLQKIGIGETNHIRIANHLKKLNYDKWVSIEMRDGLGQSNQSVVSDSLGYVTEKYRI